MDRRPVMAAIDELLCERERGIHVTAGPAARDEHVSWRVHRVWRATLPNIPAANMVNTRAEPPKDTNGSGIPDTGSRPVTAPMLMTAWPTTQTVMPAESNIAEAVGRAQRSAGAEDCKGDEERDHQHAADKTKLLADDREDEVGVRVRQEQPLRPSVAEADARPAPAAQRDERLRQLVAAGRCGLERVEEAEDAGPPVRCGDRDDRGERDPGAATIRELAQPQASDDQDRAHDQCEHHRGGHVGLSHHQEGDDTEDHEDGSQHAAPIVQLVGAPRHHVGRVDEERELGDLAGLEAPRAHAEPAPGAEHVGADAGHEHEYQQRHADDQQWANEAAPLVVVDAGRDHERDDTEGRPHELTLEEVPRRAVAGERRDCRCREHHDEADDVEHRDGGEQEHVVGRSCRTGRSPAAAQHGQRRAAPRGEPPAHRCGRRGVVAVLPRAPRAARPRGRSRRLAPRSSRTSRTRRTRETTARRRRARPSPRRLEPHHASTLPARPRPHRQTRPRCRARPHRSQ